MSDLLWKNKKVLIAEDDEANQHLMCSILDDLKCNFAIAENGQQALEKLKQEVFDLVFMDIRMPVKDGYETTRAIREEIHPKIPIIAVTAHTMEWVPGKCYAAGMNAYVEKPFRIDTVKDLLCKFLAPQT